MSKRRPFQNPYFRPFKPLMGQAVVKEKKKPNDVSREIKSPWLRRVLKRLRK